MKKNPTLTELSEDDIEYISDEDGYIEPAVKKALKLPLSNYSEAQVQALLRGDNSYIGKINGNVGVIMQMEYEHLASKESANITAGAWKETYGYPQSFIPSTENVIAELSSIFSDVNKYIASDAQFYISHGDHIPKKKIAVIAFVPLKNAAHSVLDQTSVALWAMHKPSIRLDMERIKLGLGKRQEH